MAPTLRPLPIRRQQGVVWLHRLALLTAAATFLLIAVGGIVTSTGAGLAVPDWPTTFGHNMFLYPWSKMVGGIFYEHSHRLIGAGVGLLTVTLVVWLWAVDPRAWVRWLGIVACIAVITQGVLGGLRVVLLGHTLAVVHAALAQAFFALMVGVAFFTSEEGRRAARTTSVGDAIRVRRLALVTVGVIYVQLIFGAVLRHTGRGLVAHLLGALVVTILIWCLTASILKSHAGQSKLVHAAVVLGGLLFLQLGLGLGAYWGKYTAAGMAHPSLAMTMLPTAHVATGALVLATGLVLTLRVYRLLALPAPVREFTSIPSVERSEHSPA